MTAETTTSRSFFSLSPMSSPWLSFLDRCLTPLVLVPKWIQAHGDTAKNGSLD